jgi:hypothetical protein
MENNFKWYSAEYVREYIQNNSLSERNSFNSDVSIMIIGHLSHIDILIDFYKGIKNVLFVVDDTEDKSKVDRLIQNGFKTITYQTPSNSGFGNVNKQCGASKLGAEYLDSIGAKYCIRMRSDQIILQLDKFINDFYFDKLGVLAYVNSEGGYLMDYCISGPVKDMILTFDYQEDGQIQKAAEKKIVETFLSKSGKEVDTTYDNLKSHYYFMLPTLVKNEINFLMIKQGYHDWTVAMPLQPDLYWVESNEHAFNFEKYIIN